MFQVKLIDTLETIESSLFTAAHRNWSLTQTDGNTVYIKVDGEGNPVPLKYEDREKYCQEVRRIKLEEFDEQVSMGEKWRNSARLWDFNEWESIREIETSK